MVAQVLIHFKLCSLKDDTFEKLMMIKSNHHSKFVNNLKIADQLTKILKYQTISIYVAYPSTIKYADLKYDESKIKKKHIGMNCALCTFF